MKVYIIAEAGVNHNGSVSMAKELIEIASSCGADAIKFQSFSAENLTTRSAAKAEYQRTEGNESQFEMLKRLELKEDDYHEISEFCQSREISFLSSPFDIKSLNILQKFNPDFIKVASGEITNLPLLEKIAEVANKVILSTGLSNIEDISKAIDILSSNGLEKKNLSLLHANTMYPTPFSDANLKAINTLRERFDLNVGYSDHTSGIEASIAAVAMGASIIEKHFTISKKLSGPDHKASLEPLELEALVKSIRNVELALGTGEKQPTNSELVNINAVRKSIVAAKKIKKGELFNIDNITTKRPGNGISPMEWYSVLKTKAKKDYEIDDLI